MTVITSRSREKLIYQGMGVIIPGMSPRPIKISIPHHDGEVFSFEEARLSAMTKPIKLLDTKCRRSTRKSARISVKRNMRKRVRIGVKPKTYSRKKTLRYLRNAELLLTKAPNNTTCD